MTRAVHYTSIIDLARPLAPVANPVASATPVPPVSGSHPVGSLSLAIEPPAAYRVPFEVDRRGPERIELRNVGGETLQWVTIDLIGPGHFMAHTPTRLESGDALAVWLFGEDLAQKTKVQVSWFRGGEQYLWSVSL